MFLSDEGLGGAGFGLVFPRFVVDGWHVDSIIVVGSGGCIGGLW